MKFDVFLSYKSEDQTWVQELADALLKRGVTVWMDQRQIRPGDLFATALERGLESSAAVALIVTEASMTSNWVREEYNRALSLAEDGKLQLIPVIRERMGLPGFLKGRSWLDFRDENRFDLQVDRLIWPGITGQRIRCCGVSARGRAGSDAWNLLLRSAEAEGVEFAKVEDIHRAGWFLETHQADQSSRLVVFIDPFEDRPANKSYVRNSVGEYVEFLLGWRSRTKGTANELVFVLFHQNGAWDMVPEASSVPTDVRRRLEHYFFLPHETATDRRALRRIWNDVQRDILEARQSDSGSGAG